MALGSSEPVVGCSLVPLGFPCTYYNTIFRTIYRFPTLARRRVVWGLQAFPVQSLQARQRRGPVHLARRDPVHLAHPVRQDPVHLGHPVHRHPVAVRRNPVHPHPRVTLLPMTYLLFWRQRDYRVYRENVIATVARSLNL